MSHERDEDGKLIYIVCDWCEKKIRPGQNDDGWLTLGSDSGIGTKKFYQHACPRCQREFEIE